MQTRAEVQAEIQAEVDAPSNKFRASVSAIELVLVCAALLISIVVVLHAWKGAPFEQLTRDPAAVFDAPMYIGFLSQAGCLIWAAAAATCGFAAALLAGSTRDAEPRRFLIASALVTLMLGLDDMFLLHEQFFPFIGIPEKLVYVLYGAAVLAYLVRFRRLILESPYPLLGMAMFLFAFSVLLDVVQPEGIDIFLLEDGAKVTGILSWAAYFFAVGRFHAARAMGSDAPQGRVAR